jgi:hypothetical protein
LLIAGPWLQSGYLFGTDWPGPRRFDFPIQPSSSAPVEVVFAITSRIVSGELTGKLVVIGLLFVAALTAFRAIPVEGFVPKAAASMVYVFNPFVYGRLHYGQLLLLAGYAVLPWAVVRLRQLLLDPGAAAALLAALSLWLVGVLSLHSFLIAWTLGASLLLAYTVAARDRFAYLKHLAPSLLLGVGATLAASAYWLIPLLLGSGPAGSVIARTGSGDLVAYAAVPDPQLGLLPNLLGLYGFWAEDVGRFTSMKDFVPLWPVVLGVLLLVAAAGAIANLRSRRDRLTPWVAGLLMAAAIALILEAGISQPLTARLISWLDANLPLYRGMRDAGKWAALLAFVYSQLVGLGAAAMLGWLRERTVGIAQSELLISIGTGLLLALPLFYGNGLLYGMHGEIVPSQYPVGWYSADRVLSADRHPGRTLFLPWHEYMALSFVRNENSVTGPSGPSFFSTPVLVSADPEVAGIPPPTEPVQVAIADLVAARGQGRWAEVLAAHDIKYVLLAREVDWRSYAFLDNQTGLVMIGDYGSIVLYRNDLVR